MSSFVTIQKAALDIGVDDSYIRTMIKNDDLTAYKKDGYKRIYIDMDEFDLSLVAVNNTDEAVKEDIDLDNFLV